MNKHYGFVIVFCCCLIMGVCVALVFSCAGIFYTPVSTELGISVGKFGIYVSILYLSSALMLAVAGKLMEKYSARLLLASSSTVLGFCFIAMSYFNSVYQFYFSGGVMGITMAFLLYLSFPMLINRWFKSNVGFYIGLCSAFSGIGGVLFNPLGAYLITSYGWRTTYCIFGFIILGVITPILGLLLRNFPADKGLLPYGTDQAIHKTLIDEGIEYAVAVKSVIFYGMMIFAFLMISVSTLNLFLPNYATSLGYTLSQSSLVASFIMLGVTIGKIVLGIVNDKNSVMGVLLTMSCGIAGLALLLFGKVGILILILGGFLFGWAYAGVTVETALLVRAVFGSKEYARIYSHIAIALAGGGTLAAGGWGILADFVGFQLILIVAILFLSVCAVIGLYALRVSNKGENK